MLEYFDAVKVGLTATPALHTTDIFGDPVFTYSYRQAVIDGYLIDHEPPGLGMRFARRASMRVHDMIGLRRTPRGFRMNPDGGWPVPQRRPG